jgi:hypothetical protein
LKKLFGGGGGIRLTEGTNIKMILATILNTDQLSERHSFDNVDVESLDLAGHPRDLQEELLHHDNDQRLIKQ